MSLQNCSIKNNILVTEVIKCVNQIIIKSKNTPLELNVFTMKYLSYLLCKGSLEIFWFIRNFYNSSDYDVCSNISFKVVHSKLNYYNNDLSLKTLLRMCNCPTIECNSEQLKSVQVLAPLYNTIFQSSRQNFLCYDCGTVARAVFLSLITVHRKKFYLSYDEYKRIVQSNMFDKYTPLVELQNFKNSILNSKKGGIALCGIGIGDKFGHVWNIEKTFINKKPIYRIYQSALNSYLLYDFLAYMDYPELDKKGGYDIHEYCDLLEIILQKYNTSEWTLSDNYIFTKLFCFYPSSRNTNDDKLSFSSTFIEY